jgi:hypothetical protein
MDAMDGPGEPQGGDADQVDGDQGADVEENLEDGAIDWFSKAGTDIANEYVFGCPFLSMPV